MSAACAPLRVLAHAARVPWPLRHGGSLRLHHFLRELARSAHVTLATLDAPESPTDLPPGVAHVRIPRASTARHVRAPLAQRIARSFLGYEPAIGHWLREHSARFDVALLSGAGRCVYAHDIRTAAVCDLVDDPLLYLVRDALAHPRRWPVTLRGMAGFAVALRAALRPATAAIVSSESDARALRRYSGARRVSIVSNGVDAEAFAAIAPGGEPGVLAFVGSLSFPPNIDAITWFARLVWPRVRAGGHATRLLVVGKQPTAPVAALAQLDGVELVADVPDIRPYLQRASVVIVPTRTGGGIKNKILEACAAQRAVVASPIAVADLSARHQRELLVARHPDEWVDAIARLRTDAPGARRMAEAGRAWVRRAHSWPDCAARLLAVLRSAAENQGTAAKVRAAPPERGIAECACP